MRRKIAIAFGVISILLAIGTLFYHQVEGWNWVDSFYFTGITMLTIGYGDIHPTTPFTKVATVFFAISTVAIFLYCLAVIGNNLPKKLIRRHRRKRKTRRRRRR